MLSKFLFFRIGSANVPQAVLLGGQLAETDVPAHLRLAGHTVVKFEVTELTTLDARQIASALPAPGEQLREAGIVYEELGAGISTSAAA